MSKLIYDLNIDQYSFTDLLNVFSIPTIDVTSEHIKLAKRKLAQIHPDKSKLPPEYFVFYKAAYDRIVYQYNSDKSLQSKIESNISKANTGYNSTEFKIEKGGSKFSNEVFEHITNYKQKKDFAEKKNNWFTDESQDYNLNSTRRLVNNTVSIYNELKPLCVNTGANFYDDDDNANDEEYISSNIFSTGLKYDDIRKVHNDQTVSGIDMTTFSEKPRNLEQYKQEQSRVYDPIKKQVADNHFKLQELKRKEMYINNQYRDNIRSDQYIQRQQYITGNQDRLK